MPRHRYTARTSDAHHLYELSVQDPEADIHQIDRWFRRIRGRRPLALREDFCGTAWLCAEWIKSDPARHAIGVDLDARTMAWGRRRHFRPGDPGGAPLERMRFLRADVRRARTAPADVLCAFNFSWCVFLDRPTLLGYFRAAHRALARDGLFALDIHGGHEVDAACRDERRMGGFTYVWEQGPLDPITHRSIRRIHFEFPDGSALRDVYRYDWRVWALPETREALLEAGFRRIDVLWELYDREGGGSGIFRRVERARNEDSWVAYLLAWK